MDPNLANKLLIPGVTTFGCAVTKQVETLYKFLYTMREDSSESVGAFFKRLGHDSGSFIGLWRWLNDAGVSGISAGFEEFVGLFK
tara:strand:- start:959 stop:1213 length:255 start_codon:yes stop_codon:yes gene_type:complete